MMTWPKHKECDLLSALLVLLLSNAIEEVIVCVKSLQDILFQLWQKGKRPREWTGRGGGAWS